MARTVFCKKYQKDLEGLITPPYPGPKGQDVFDNVSKQAWEEWQQHQVRLINEKQLSMINADDRKYLLEQMDNFFSNKDVDQAEGYVPEES